MLHRTSWLILWIIFMPHDLQKKMAPVILQWLRYTWLGEKKHLILLVAFCVKKCH